MEKQKKIDTLWAKNSKAFQMFKDEVARNVKEAETILDLGEGVDSKFQNSVCMHFHQTKGVAGMFGLDDIAHAAAELEEVFGGDLVAVLAKNIEITNLLQQIKISMQEVEDA